MSKAGLTKGLKGKTFIVQGLGNVGFWASKFLTETGGAKCIGVCEYNSAILCENGINIEDLEKHKKSNGILIEFNFFLLLNPKHEIGKRNPPRIPRGY